jgi:hypothetical protein
LIIVGIIGTVIAMAVVGVTVEMTGDVGGVGYDPGSSMMAVLAVGLLYIIPAFLLALRKRWAWIIGVMVLIAELIGFSMSYASGFMGLEPLSYRYSFAFTLYLVPIVLVLWDTKRYWKLKQA